MQIPIQIRQRSPHSETPSRLDSIKYQAKPLDNAGFIDFSPSKATGKGKMIASGWFGKKKPLELQVYKVSDVPRRCTSDWGEVDVKPWSHYSEKKFWKYYGRSS
ncbi:hypothetical protein BDV19DRAFT_360978 [Aspergillus venezuelensis]